MDPVADELLAFINRHTQSLPQAEQDSQRAAFDEYRIKNNIRSVMELLLEPCYPPNWLRGYW